MFDKFKKEFYISPEEMRGPRIKVNDIQAFGEFNGRYDWNRSSIVFHMIGGQNIYWNASDDFIRTKEHNRIVTLISNEVK